MSKKQNQFKGKFPMSFKIEILSRALGAEALADIKSKYRAAKYKLDDTKLLEAEYLYEALGEEGLEELYDKYQDAKKLRDQRVPPSDKDMRLANLAKSEPTYAAAARKAGVPVEFVYAAVSRVSKWQFLHNK
jgi:hypothetical protein